MGTRRAILRSLAAALAMPATRAFAQSAAKRPMLGVIVFNIRGNASFVQLVGGLRDLGYVDGQNITIVTRSADGNAALLPALAQELVRLDVNVIYATGPASISAARGATSTIPIVALDLESDPVATGWAQSLARPGGNITGLFLDLPAFAGKWLELMGEVLPGARRFGLIWDSTAGSTQLTGAKAAAQRLEVELAIEEVKAAADIGGAFASLARGRARGVMIMSSPVVAQQSQTLARHANDYRLPTITPFRAFAEAGGLMSYGPRFDDFRRRAPAFVVKILQGAKPAELPIEQPTKFELVVNLRTAKTLGLTLPQSLLVRADEVIS